MLPSAVRWYKNDRIWRNVDQMVKRPPTQTDESKLISFSYTPHLLALVGLSCGKGFLLIPTDSTQPQRNRDMVLLTLDFFFYGWTLVVSYRC